MWDECQGLGLNSMKDEYHSNMDEPHNICDGPRMGTTASRKSTAKKLPGLQDG
jgi:hypothetical protein